MENDLIFRIICSFFTGALLSIAGSFSQLVTFNSMSSPSTLGVQAYVVLIVLMAHFLALLSPLEFGPLSIICISLFFSILIYIFSSKKVIKKYSNKTSFVGDKIVLAGICFNLFVGALFSFAHFLSMSLNIRFPMSIWYGHFKYASSYTSIALIVVFIIAFIFILKHKKLIRYFNLGPDFLNSLDLRVGNFSKNSLLLILVLTTVVVGNFGVFSFLGLIFPHFLRSFKLFSNDTFREITFGPIISGVILMCFDMLCYFFPFWGAEIPVGMLSSIIGALYLVIYFTRKLKVNN
jgi:ABC-type Fe3+-siderophore transport system permease subunit